jgi:hypothetical protein
MRVDKDTEMGNLALNVEDWSVAFIIENQEITTNEYTFEIPEFHPGRETIQKKIDIYNTGDSDSDLKYEILEIYLYGEQIYKVQQGASATLVPETIGEEVIDNVSKTTTANMFGNEEATIFDEENANYTYSLRYPTPFTISYTYEKSIIAGKDGSPASRAWMTFDLEWTNDEANNEEDTRLGEMVYDFENAKDAEGNLINEGEPALRIKARITAKKRESDNTYSNVVSP